MTRWLSATSWSQFEPRTENSIGNPRWAVKPCWERSWRTARSPGDGVELAPENGRQLGLAELPFLGWDDRHEQVALVDAAAEPADEAVELGDLGPLDDDVLGLLDELIGLRQIGADGRLHPDR